MTFQVTITPSAIVDLHAISRWIEDRADAIVADRYDARIRSVIAKLATFPQRGSNRSDLGEGLRSISFEGRILIVYRVTAESVDIRRIVHGARDIDDLDFT
ncbi:type II toxin-antitoxin system RelE/ParE family toxin [Sphingomonas sp. RS2018]